MDSHIQVPKCVLKRFGVKHRFFYYDVEKGIIRNNGHSKSFNTQVGYYSSGTEQYLSDNIETPIGKLLKAIDEMDSSSDAPPVIPNLDRTIKTYIYSLMSRDPGMRDRINRHSVLYQFCPEQSQNVFSAVAGIKISQEKDFFKSHTATLIINRTSTPFLLPVLGFCAAHESGVKYALVPLLPSAAGVLIPNAAYDNYANKGQVPYYLIDNEAVVRDINRETVKVQIRAGCGMIVSPTRTALEDALRSE